MFGPKKLSIAAVVVVFSFLLRLRVERELMSPKGLPGGQRREEEAGKFVIKWRISEKRLFEKCE